MPSALIRGDYHREITSQINSNYSLSLSSALFEWLEQIHFAFTQSHIRRTQLPTLQFMIHFNANVTDIVTNTICLAPRTKHIFSSTFCVLWYDFIGLNFSFQTCFLTLKEMNIHFKYFLTFFVCSDVVELNNKKEQFVSDVHIYVMRLEIVLRLVADVHNHSSQQDFDILDGRGIL